MESARSNLRYEWKKYVVALWMIGITVFVFQIDTKVRSLVDRIHTIASTVESVEGLVSGSDYTLGTIEQQVAALEKSVSVISRKVKRLR